MVHARLGIGAENSGLLVTLVRKHARELAEKRGIDLMLVDGPPGIGCPVIASLTGADGALVVTEPTKSGLHDLNRVVGLADHFDIPVSVCINKFDINETMSEKIESYCEKRGLSVVGKIPYDPTVTDAQLAGKPVVEHDSSPAAAAIKSAWSNMETLLKQ
jgi:MinD superfamily P-loop ATPase